MLTEPQSVVEASGRGVSGTVSGRRVTIGARSYVAELHPEAGAEVAAAGEMPLELRAYVAIDGQFAGTITFGDQLRPQLAGVLAALRTGGVREIQLLSGDTAGLWATRS